MVLDHREHYLAPVHVGLDALVAPIQYTVDVPINTFSRLMTNFSSQQSLLAENTHLKVQQLLLEAKLQKLSALENENSELRNLLKSFPKIHNDRMLIAQLLAVSMNPLVSELILDKGSRDGIYEGQPVLDAHGIMGQIIQDGPWTSRVLLISDLRSAVPVQDLRNGVRGIVVGRGNLMKLSLTNIPETVDVQVGDVLMTSGLGGHYPEGYPVGVISSIRHNSGEQFTKIEVNPLAQLDRTRSVLLLWPTHVPMIDTPKIVNKPTTKNISEKKPPAPADHLASVASKKGDEKKS